MKYSTSLFALLLAVIIFHHTSAAQETKHQVLSGFEMSLGAGYSSFAPASLTSINEALAAKGYAPAANGFIMENLSIIHLYTHNFYFGLDLDLLNKKTIRWIVPGLLLPELT